MNLEKAMQYSLEDPRVVSLNSQGQ
jgi:hypothetical protein